MTSIEHSAACPNTAHTLQEALDILREQLRLPESTEDDRPPVDECLYAVPVKGRFDFADYHENAIA